jgi:predicted transposase/invertase (TIGR01784 family)
MKTDTLFYQLFQEFPWIFFQLIQLQPTNLDAYQFIAPEIKQRSFRLDGLFTTTEEYSNLPLYFVEAQFYNETDFYDRLFPSIFLYFSQYKPVNSEWYVVVIFDKQSNDVTIPPRYEELAAKRLQRFYLDEMPQSDPTSLGLGILKLVVEPEAKAGELARSLIERSKEEFEDNLDQKQLLELIETIVIYKFPQLSYEDIETMLNLEAIKQTRVYQEGKAEGKAEGKLEIVPKLLKKGLSIQEVAELLELDLEIIRKAAQG